MRYQTAPLAILILLPRRLPIPAARLFCGRKISYIKTRIAALGEQD